MNDLALPGESVQTAMLEAVCDALAATVILYDRNDRILFTGRKILSLLPLREDDITAGTRLRDFLSALYDGRKAAGSGATGGGAERQADRHGIERDDWVADQLAIHWKERSERVERQHGDRWLRFTTKRLPSGLGIAVIADISEQKKREDQWRADIERVQATEEILDTLPLSILVKDHNGVYAAVNAAACALLETTRDVMLGRTVRDIHSGPVAARIDALDRRVLQTGIAAFMPQRLTRKSGEEVLVCIRRQRIGKPGRYLLVTTLDDITTLAGLQDDGRDAGFDMEADAFPPLHPQRPDDLTALLTGRKILLVSDNPLLRMGAGAQMKEEAVNFAAVEGLDEQSAFIDVAAAAGVHIDLVMVDVEMDIACLDLARANGLAVITLDNVQLDNGLVALAAQYFRNRAQAGLTVQPDNDWRLAASQPPVFASRKHLNVLVVEDNTVNQIVFSQILEGLGIAYRIAANGQQAVTLFESESPSMVLVDTTLPDVDGFEVARRMRGKEAQDVPRTPIIGVLPRPFEGDRQACIDAGMDEILLKPISPDMVETMIMRFTAGGERRYG